MRFVARSYPSMRGTVPLLLLFAVLGAGAQDNGAAQAQAQAQAREFRLRVAQLALIYGESSGLDPAGARVEARRLRELPGGCAEVEVSTSSSGASAQGPLRDRLRVCAAPH